MNKRFLLVAALCAAMNLGAFAQTNLAEGKTAHASTNDDNAKASVDGNIGTRWEVNTGANGEGALADNNYWYYVDLGSVQDFNVLQIVWEGGYAKAFQIYTANDVDDTTQEPKWGEAPVYTQESTTIENAGGKEVTYKIGDQKARFVKIKATELGYSPYFSFFEFRVMKMELQATLKELTVSKDIVKVGDTFTVNALDQFGENLTDADITVTNAEKQADGSFKATTAGDIVITAKAGDVTLNKTVFAISKAAEVPELADTDLSIYADDATGLGISDPGWNGKYDKQQQLDLDGNKVFMVTNAGTFGIKNDKIANDGYTSLNFDIFPTTDVTGHVEIEGSGLANLPFTLKAGEWNHVSLDITGAKALNNWIQIHVGAAGADNNPDILLDNVYLSKKAAEVKEEVNIAKTVDDRGFVAVTGYAKSADIINNALTDANVTAWDLSGLKTDGNYTITPANPNAMIQVAGTVNGEGVGVPTAEWGETKNLIVKRGDGYLFPVKQIEITDNASPVYTAFFISTGNTGWKYTRQLPANTWVTTVLPAAAEIPAGCKVYEMTENTEKANTITLKEATAIDAKTPYIIFNSNAEEATLATSGTGDLKFNEEIAAKAIGDVTVHGTFQKLNGNGSMYGLQGQTGETQALKLKKIGENATTAPFRVYFTSDVANIENYSLIFNNGETTGINNIDATNQVKATKGIYTLDGRYAGNSLQNVPAGVYIVNGKKIVK